MAEGEASLGVHQQLESVLSNLYDFGDDFVSPKETIPEQGEINGSSVEKEAKDVRGGEDEQQTMVSSKRGKKNVSMFFDSIREELCSQAKNANTSSSSPTVVTFVSRKKQGKDVDVQDTERNSEKDDNLNLEKVRLEVHKFGLKGYSKETQRKFEKDRAIMLGARPPKREHVNYKLFQEQIKQKKEAEKAQMENGMGPERKKQKKNDKSAKMKKSSKAPSGQVGKFKGGALFLSDRDIVKIKKSRVGK